MQTVRIILAVLICLACLCALYIGFVFTVGSGFIFAGDIDLTDEQREKANTIATIASFFGFVVMLVSPFVMLLSGVISKRILEFFGAKIDEFEIMSKNLDEL